jgi:hypothetical protein
MIFLAATGPSDASGKADTDAWQTNVGIGLLLALWFGGIVHALLVNPAWLLWRASHPRH